MNVGLHPHVIGQPHGIAALREFMAYVKAKSHIWFATREEIATWYLGEAQRHMRRGSYCEPVDRFHETNCGA